ncbi:MAG: non-canonical purine NTP pyrophosphatase [Inhella sp.]|nr:non-canonical purine NTP pyrophosphatase [Inhella sp.]
MSAKRLLLASNNAKKLTELRALLVPLGVELLAQGDLAIAEAAEPFDTFLENALAKARHAAHASGLPTLADDSGLCVDALGGEPGVRSSRFALDAGQGEGDADNNRWLLQRLHGQSQREAAFVCVLVALRHAADPEPLVATGRWPLTVLDAAQGGGGFGYDPIVRPRGARAGSVATLTEAEKNAHSHRALAMRQLVAQLRERWLW